MSLAPRPGPGVIQRANSLQASDTSHTSTTTDASTNTSVSHSNKPSPVSSIGESISSVVKPVHIPPARPVRPLPTPPSRPPLPSPALTSTSTLKLSHQESHSTLGKSSPNTSKPASSSTLTLTKSKTTPPRKLMRNRPDADSSRPPLPPPSAFNPRRISDDENWVSISILPVVAERAPDERFPANVHDSASYAKPTAASSSKRTASTGTSAKPASKQTARSASTSKTTSSKSLPRLPQPTPPLAQQPSQPQSQDGAWKLEFRGVIRLVRWVSRRDKRAESENVNPARVEDEKLVVEQRESVGRRKGFSVSNEARRSRDSYTQPVPRPNAPPAGGPVRARPLSIVRPRPQLEGDKGEKEKRRLTKSNPGLVHFADLGPESGPRARMSTDVLRASTDSRADGRRTSSDIGLGRYSSGGGILVTDASLGVQANGHPPRTSSLPLSSLSPPVLESSSAGLIGILSEHQLDRPVSETSLAYLQPERLNGVLFTSEDDATVTPASYSYLHSPLSPAPGTQITTVTQTSTTQTTTTYQSSPLSITQTQSTTQTQTQSALGFTFSPYSGNSVLSPVLEVPLFTHEFVASPPELAAGNVEFPWTGTNASRVRVGEVVPSGSVIFRTGVDGAVARQVDTIVNDVLGSAPLGAGAPFASIGDSLSPLSNSVSPPAANSASPISSGSLSPLMSNSASPLMSNVASSSTSPMPSNVYLSDPYAMSQPPPTAASSLSYTTARSNRNIPTAQAIFEGRTAETLVDSSTFDHDPAYLLRSGAATDIGHGYVTRATSPTPSDRFALTDDGHGYRPTGGILRALSSSNRSNSPLPMPRRPFMPSRGSSGSVTFEDSSVQSSPRMGGRRKIMTMSASDVGHGGGDRFTSVLAGSHYGYGRPKPAVQRSKSSLSLAGRIIRKLSIGSNSGSRGQEDETEQPRLTRKLTRRKTASTAVSPSSLASSTVSLPYGDEPSGIPPVPPLPPGVVPSKYFRGESEIGHGQSEVGHGSTNGHARGESWIGNSAWGGSTSVIGHDSTTSHTLVSPAPTHQSFATTQSAPAFSGGRKLVKKRQSQSRRAQTLAPDMPARTLTSLDFPSEPVSMNPPRISTEFLQVPLMGGDHQLTMSAEGGTDDGHFMPPRPGMPRRTSSQRRWTIADMDDDEFLRQLEVKLSGSGSRLRKSRVLEEFAMGADQGHEDVEAEADPGSETDDSAAEREWVKARRAMMCVREIVRTEKSYLRHLTGFSNGDQSNMSSILLEHLPRLVEISRIFAARLEEDPSAWGVSVAFLAVEDQLEAALVDWSGVVGQVISAMRVGGESQAASDDGHTSSAGSNTSSWIRRRSATASAASQPFQLNLTMTPMISKDKKSARIVKSKRLTEQDVAIMPTQRVLRYVLMYRELLLHTPLKSASRPLVERALQGATRIARLCDEAQTHVDILSPT